MILSNDTLNRIKVGAYADEAELHAFVRECDHKIEREMFSAIERTVGDADARFLGLTGPTCSGKTTAARRMTSFLQSRGHPVYTVSIDNFFYDKDYLEIHTAKGEDGIPDYDSEDTVDVELFEKTVSSLLCGRETRMPIFDFHAGARGGWHTVRPGERDVYLFEGIQVLYPKIRSILSVGGCKTLCICPRSELEVGGEVFSPNEIRLFRRLVRDFRHRSAEPEFTFLLWKGVRENEETSIFPYLADTAAWIDSVMPYEIGMLKPYLEAVLDRVEETQKCYGAATEIREKIAGIQPISSDYLTHQSLYKEFI